MIFKIKAGKVDSTKILVTGYLLSGTKEEKKLLDIMIDEFKNIKTYNDKFSTSGNYVVFKSVEFGELKQVLNYLSETLEFNLSYKISDGYCGDKQALRVLQATMDKK